MIPTDVASRLQVSSDLATRAVAPAQEITEKLPDLAVGQRVLAEIQALLPNGTYRALINQRNVTLALPFAAKSGDTLELQVTDTDGKLTLAVVPSQEGEQKAGGAVSTSLSRTAQLISDLLAPKQENAGSSTKGLALNGSKPLSDVPPKTAADILPILKQAIQQSGMFYESHQAEWVEGRYPKNALLNEPQGRLSSSQAFASAALEQQPRSSTQPSGTSPTNASTAPVQANSPGVESQLSTSPTRGELIAPQTQGLVQHQLDALATQLFVWQGQAWPGQEMRWEIDESPHRDTDAGDDTSAQWSTRLQLQLPNLGEVDARIRIDGNQISLAIGTDRVASASLLEASSNVLRSQLDEAGLTLAAIGIDMVSPPSDADDGA